MQKKENKRAMTKKPVSKQKNSIKRKKSVQNAIPIQYMTEIESLRFGKLDANLRNCLQGIRLCDLEIDKIKYELQAKIQELLSKKNSLECDINRIREEYDPFVRLLASNYGIDDPKFMSVDPDVGIIRDIRFLQEKK